jgi:hypothetical protein
VLPLAQTQNRHTHVRALADKPHNTQHTEQFDNHPTPTTTKQTTNTPLIINQPQTKQINPHKTNQTN